MKSYLLCLFFSSFFLALFSQAYAEPWTLSEKQGFLLIYADVEIENVTMHIWRRESTSRKPIPIKIDKVEGGSWVRVPLKSGRYVVKSVNTPYFDLPFKLHLDEKRAWDFRVADQKTNYFGVLHVGGERTRSTVDVRRYNRIGEQIQEIRNYANDNLEQYPLVTAYEYRDDFASSLLRAEPQDG
jgi:hypothetical protein